MDAAIFSPNGKNFVHFISIFVPKPSFWAHFRVEQNFAYFLIFQESQILGVPIVGLRSRSEILRPMAGSARKSWYVCCHFQVKWQDNCQLYVHVCFKTCFFDQSRLGQIWIIFDFRYVTVYDFRPALWLGCLGQAARLGWAGLAGAGWARLARRPDSARLGGGDKAGLGWPS